mgnify:CR=1 FL=1
MTLLLLTTAQAQMMLPLPQKMNVPSETGHISEKDLIDARKPLPPDELEAKPGRQDFNLKDSSRSLFERVAGAFGLEVVFDTDYQELNNVRFQVSDLNYRDSLRALEAATDSFLTPVSKHLIFVARDTASKRRDFARNVAVTIPIPDPVSVETDFASYKSSVTAKANVLHYEREYVVKKVEIPASEAAEFSKLEGTILADEQGTAVLKKAVGGGS